MRAPALGARRMRPPPRAPITNSAVERMSESSPVCAPTTVSDPSRAPARLSPGRGCGGSDTVGLEVALVVARGQTVASRRPRRPRSCPRGRADPRCRSATSPSGFSPIATVVLPAEMIAASTAPLSLSASAARSSPSPWRRRRSRRPPTASGAAVVSVPSSGANARRRALALADLEADAASRPPQLPASGTRLRPRSPRAPRHPKRHRELSPTPSSAALYRTSSASTGAGTTRMASG